MPSIFSFTNLSFIGNALLSSYAIYKLLNQRYHRIENAGYIIAIILIPYIGAISFLFFRTSNRTFYFGEQRNIIYDSYKSNLANSNFGFPSPKDMKLEKIILDGDFAKVLLDMIKSSKKSIAISTYFMSGKFARNVIKELDNAGNRGLHVYLIIDLCIGSLPIFIKYLILKLFGKKYNFNILFWFSFPRLSNIIHSKVACFDSKKFTIGSHNINDAIIYNLSILCSGPIVIDYIKYLNNVWKEKTGKSFHNSLFHYKKESSIKYNTTGQILYSGNNNMYMNFYYYIQNLLNSAKDRILISTPYIFLIDGFIDSLLIARQKGVKVQILTPEKMDHNSLKYPRMLELNKLSDFNIDIFFSMGTFNHSKYIIVDDAVITGSHNFDLRGFLCLSMECDILIKDKKIASSFLSHFNSFKKKSYKYNKDVNDISKLKLMIGNLMATLDIEY